MWVLVCDWCTPNCIIYVCICVCITHQENMRVIFDVFVSGNHIFEHYVFVMKVFQDLCLWIQVFNVWSRAIRSLSQKVGLAVSGDTQFHMTIGRVSKRFNPRTHAVMMPSSQVTIGHTSKPLDPRLFAVTMVLSQVTIGRTLKSLDPRLFAVTMVLSQVTIGRTLKSLDPCLFAVTMVLSQVTIGRTSKPFDPQVPTFPLIIVQPLLVR